MDPEGAHRWLHTASDQALRSALEAVDSRRPFALEPARTDDGDQQQVRLPVAVE